jgi:pimeloyl-ACP methyl ester carboxylesterase
MSSIAAYASNDVPQPVALTTAAPEVATRYLQLPEGTIAYDDRGAGPLVVMVPGLGDLRQEYRFLAPPLLAAGYRVVTMDLRGHGGSSTGWPSYSTAAIGADVLALLRHLEGGPAILIGTSLGAGAVVWSAAEAPALIGGLVLIGPFVREVPAPWLKSLIQNLLMRFAFTGPWAPAAWSAFYKSLYPARRPANFADYLRALSASLKQPGRMAATKAMMLGSKAEIEAVHAKVTAPTIVVMGSRDPDFSDPAAEAELIASRLNGSVAMIAGAGHYPHAEMPEETTPTILRFIREVGAV